MGNVESCCAYGASPRPDRTPKLKPGGAYRGSNNRSNGHYAHQQVGQVLESKYISFPKSEN